MKTIFPERIEKKIVTGSYMHEEDPEKQKIIEFLFRKIREVKKSRRRIVLPESGDERVLRAAEIVIKHRIADIILIGEREKILKGAVSQGIDVSGAEIISGTEKRKEYARLLYTLRKHRGMSMEHAMKKVRDPIYYGTLMVRAGDAHGMVAGAVTSSDRVLRAALEIIGSKPDVSTISGAFLMFIPKNRYGERFSKRGVFIFADCAVNIDPDYKQLADIAAESAETMRMFGIKPRIALLSYLTNYSKNYSACRTKMCRAEGYLKKRRPDLDVEETQLDAAIDLNVSKIKNPGSVIGGRSNVLIFPDLQSGNIGYKLVERFGDAEAIGPIVQGLQKPVNDLSRGASAEDIVNLVAVTAYQACCFI